VISWFQTIIFMSERIYFCFPTAAYTEDARQHIPHEAMAFRVGGIRLPMSYRMFAVRMRATGVAMSADAELTRV
jgi:hypothetical protein